MKHPPYHLTVNKAIDRCLLVEILDILNKHCPMSDYTYYGFGGPFLEDCRLIHSRCPEIKVVSIEKNKQTFERQKFHSSFKNLELRHEDFASFVANFSSKRGEVFWLDFTKLVFGHFDDFMSILQKVSKNSVVKITLRSEPPSNAGVSIERDKNWQDFQQEFEHILPPTATREDIERAPKFIKLLHEMIEIASQQALPASGESVFQLLNSCYYKDSTQMLSVTGIVCNKHEVSKVRRWFKGWKFLNLEWNKPLKIDVPILSIKERLHLEKYLPTKRRTGLAVSRALGYSIDCTSAKNIQQMKQYEEFYQYYPYFARVSI